AIAAYAVGGRGVGGLEGELDVVEARFLEGVDSGLVEEDAGGDQVGVEAQARGMGDDRLEVAAQRRLAAREVELEHAKLVGLGGGTGPLLPGELTRGPPEL